MLRTALVIYHSVILAFCQDLLHTLELKIRSRAEGCDSNERFQIDRKLDRITGRSEDTNASIEFKSMRLYAIEKQLRVVDELLPFSFSGLGHDESPDL